MLHFLITFLKVHYKKINQNPQKKRLALISAGLLIVGGFITAVIVKQDSKAVEIQSVQLQDGDIIFQSSPTGESKIIEHATKAKYSHLGIIYLKDGSYFVLEAAPLSCLTPFGEWIRKGENNHYVVKRLKNASQFFTPETVLKMKNAVRKFNGKEYDYCFSWSDDKLYNSELVWKVYKEATGTEIAEFQQLKDLDLQDSLVRKNTAEKCSTPVSQKELIISPNSILYSQLFETIIEN